MLATTQALEEAHQTTAGITAYLVTVRGVPVLSGDSDTVIQSNSEDTPTYTWSRGRRSVWRLEIFPV